MCLFGFSAYRLNHLHVSAEISRQSKHVFVVRVNEFICRLIGAVISQVLKAPGRYIRLQDEIDKLVGSIRVWCINGMS